ncbi:Alkaline-phosphatase-like, core domain protein [Niveomyces insectorum RCEF 264]|uniref:Alkaline-phosphatase-like, core domain protein n=1 Tax=Niveomyces insectorum RCEF 264 TaxID=1081102 RepID=A0A167USP5_9HYPO|nr:Alkaline-phosphatase-like, core domain protein [Niveomyces insectorum RCEF 264]
MAASKRPNFLLIVADDLGFSDVGAFGGEIRTPNIDALANSSAGVRFTNFHTASMCSPTRSMLLSGTDNHIAGLGQMEVWGRGRDPPVPWSQRPGYEGYLNFRVAALPELLQDAGYYTCMSGKWHLGLTPERSPHARGFDRSFALLPGGSSHYLYQPKHPDGTPVFKHWAPLYQEDDRRVSPDDLPDDYYTSDYYTTRLLDFLGERAARPETHAKPFFAYLPFTAPHWPLQAPQENIQRYHGVYADGPDALRAQRLQRQIALGLLPDTVEAHPVVALDSEKAWDDMTPDEQAWSARTMEVFAGMVDRMDENIGRVLRYLQTSGEWDDTVVLFMSDNGAEGAVIEAVPMTGDVIKTALDARYNNTLANLGNPDSFIWYGPRWAQAATAPSRMHKGYVTEGGIRCPAIVHYPGWAKRTDKTGNGSGNGDGHGTVTNAFATVMDILPTLLNLAGVPLPGATFRGRDVVPVKGSSWVPHLTGQQPRIHDQDYVTGWELFFHQAIRKGDWKAVFVPRPKGPERWQLYNVKEDMGEIHDRAADEPAILDELIKHWLAYVSEFGVFLREELEEGYVLP